MSIAALAARHHPCSGGHYSVRSVGFAGHEFFNVPERSAADCHSANLAPRWASDDHLLDLPDRLGAVLCCDSEGAPASCELRTKVCGDNGQVRPILPSVCAPAQPERRARDQHAGDVRYRADLQACLPPLLFPPCSEATAPPSTLIAVNNFRYRT